MTLPVGKRSSSIDNPAFPITVRANCTYESPKSHGVPKSPNRFGFTQPGLNSLLAFVDVETILTSVADFRYFPR